MFTRLLMFSTVVEQASLNRASKLLNVSQPALSRHIKTLEHEAGIILFERKGKRLELTSAGQTLYEFAREERQLERRYQQAFGAIRNENRNSITIGASLTTLQATLPDLITNYIRIEPDADIKAITGKTHEIVSWIKEGKADIGLVASSIEDDRLTCVPLFRDHLSLVVPRHHDLAGKTGITIEALNGLPMILFSRGTWYRILMDELFDNYNLRPDIKMEIDSFEAILRLVSTCQNATLLPKSYLRPTLIDDNELATADIPELQKAVRTTSLVYLKAGELSSSARRFAEQTLHYFAR